MAILKIARMGHPALRRPASAVDDPTAPTVHQLIADMYETMLDANGAGLAAPQVHVPLRLVMFRITAERAAREGEAEQQELTVLVNPVIEPLSADKADGWEGCLSVPGLRGLVPRYTRIRYRGLAPSGQRLERVAEGFHARVVQHECDHLDGILYPQRMTDLTKLVFESEWRHILAELGPQDERAAD
ncbi:MAG: peptide deformylase [Alphaproteobacteria bacterium]|nr:peptide deformylase [Alphaproteobacteria bacterium]